MTCTDYGSDALNKVYGGMDCQAFAHSLPFTGMDAVTVVLLGLLLAGTGILMRKVG